MNAPLPPRLLIQISADKKTMSAAIVKELGKRYADSYEWAAIATAAGGRMDKRAWFRGSRFGSGRDSGAPLETRGLECTCTVLRRPELCTMLAGSLSGVRCGGHKTLRPPRNPVRSLARCVWTWQRLQST